MLAVAASPHASSFLLLVVACMLVCLPAFLLFPSPFPLHACLFATPLSSTSPLSSRSTTCMDACLHAGSLPAVHWQPSLGKRLFGISPRSTRFNHRPVVVADQRDLKDLELEQETSLQGGDHSAGGNHHTPHFPAHVAPHPSGTELHHRRLACA